ncbi:MAG: hypothetical protein NTY08_12995 [Proteobacteria bacterium]|nr:hypothetical protein [Pseudomonadota bacterium]
MLKPCETTILILAWCLLLALCWTAAVFGYLCRSQQAPSESIDGLGRGVIIPALVVAPVTLLIAFRYAGINLLFPIEIFATATELCTAALAPAAVLFIVSGLAGALMRQLRLEHDYWQRQPFALAAVAYGHDKNKAVRRIVLLKGFVTAWAQCLPWLYGELIIVEAVFNAPGLGLSAWHMARARDHMGLLATIGLLILLYALSVAVTAWGNSWLGRRLESYA